MKSHRWYVQHTGMMSQSVVLVAGFALQFTTTSNTYCALFLIDQFAAYLDCVCLFSSPWICSGCIILCQLPRSRSNGTRYRRRSWWRWLVLEWTSWELSTTRSFVLPRMWGTYDYDLCIYILKNLWSIIYVAVLTVVCQHPPPIYLCRSWFRIMIICVLGQVQESVERTC